MVTFTVQDGHVRHLRGDVHRDAQDAGASARPVPHAAHGLRVLVPHSAHSVPHRQRHRCTPATDEKLLFAVNVQ